ncbi:hypothetical protein AX16_002127 [Volvariella volvacea WC 439]|nr:hypothetical protein AX16_002127 [Volvariella volvacea WC 439]
MRIAGPAAEALAALTPSQIAFIKSIPKAELHAHLNGCIPISVLQQLAREHTAYTSVPLSGDAIHSGIQKLVNGVELNEIHDFFGLFPSVTALTSTPDGLAIATRAVLESFLGRAPGDDKETIDGAAAHVDVQCDYLELRSTAKHTPGMDRELYVRTVLAEIARYPKGKIGFIVSMDRKMTQAEMRDCVDVAVKLRSEGQPVVGIDLCGDPLAGDVADFEVFFERAREAGLGVTLHIAETTQNTAEETSKLLSFKPGRLGHATFLNDEQIEQVIQAGTCIEICLSSNILCKTATSLDAHHIRHYLKRNHPIAICTDDTLPFRTNLTAEYALLLAPSPLGLGLSEEEVRRIGEMSFTHRF